MTSIFVPNEYEHPRLMKMYFNSGVSDKTMVELGLPIAPYCTDADLECQYRSLPLKDQTTKENRAERLNSENRNYFRARRPVLAFILEAVQQPFQHAQSIFEHHADNRGYADTRRCQLKA